MDNLIEPKTSGQLFGRDAFIARAWADLASKSLYMNDLRRIGKTRILERMHASPPTGWLTSLSDLEGAHTAEEFAARVYRDSTAVLSGRKRTFRNLTNLLGKTAGMEIIGVIKLPDGRIAPWKEVLRATFDDMAESLAEQPGNRLVFLWDEVAYLLDNIARRQGTDTAMQVLDVLRELSQRHPGIRLLLTGSIGIHHVLRGLWGDGYKGSPLNHMDLIQPGPLELAPAREFAHFEIARRGLHCVDEAGCAAAVAELSSRVPFYIEKLVGRLSGADLSPALIEAVLDRELRSDTSDWDIDYYQRRVSTSYPGTKGLVLAILDTLAIAETPSLAFTDILTRVNARLATEEEVLREHLRLLGIDHYIVRNEANAYGFYLSLVRRWWRISRHL